MSSLAWGVWSLLHWYGASRIALAGLVTFTCRQLCRALVQVCDVFLQSFEEIAHEVCPSLSRGDTDSLAADG